MLEYYGLIDLNKEIPELKEKAVWHTRKWRTENPEQWRKEKAKRHSEKMIKQRAKRRHLGFTELNKSFEGSVAHHIDKIYVAHIPAELHNSIRHNIWTGKNMIAINNLALGWLELAQKNAGCQ